MIRYIPAEEHRIDFGKCKGEKMCNVSRSYLEWMAGAAIIRGTDDWSEAARIELHRRDAYRIDSPSREEQAAQRAEEDDERAADEERIIAEFGSLKAFENYMAEMGM